VRIPVFVSCPTSLSPEQESRRKVIVRELDRLALEPRALGRSDYPTNLPLREVLVIARHCSGGVILGFEQARMTAGVVKPGTPSERAVDEPISQPTPWNHLEAGILFGLGLPLLVFREEAVSGGVFDNGVTDAFVHPIPRVGLRRPEREALDEVFLKWGSRVREHYYA
jgi:hypothetical protein